MKKLLLVTLLIVASVASAQTVSLVPTTDDVAAIRSAWGQHQFHRSVKFQTGSPFFGQPWARFMCLWSCLTYQPAPADLKDWDFGRTIVFTTNIDDAIGNVPGEPAECGHAISLSVVGFSGTQAVLVGCTGGSIGSFTPTVPAGTWRVYLAAQTPPASATVN